jgi:hypothetical protein
MMSYWANISQTESGASKYGSKKSLICELVIIFLKIYASSSNSFSFSAITLRSSFLYPRTPFYKVNTFL